MKKITSLIAIAALTAVSTTGAIAKPQARYTQVDRFEGVFYDKHNDVNLILRQYGDYYFYTSQQKEFNVEARCIKEYRTLQCIGWETDDRGGLYSFKSSLQMSGSGLREDWVIEGMGRKPTSGSFSFRRLD